MRVSPAVEVLAAFVCEGVDVGARGGGVGGPFDVGLAHFAGWLAYWVDSLSRGVNAVLCCGGVGEN